MPTAHDFILAHQAAVQLTCVLPNDCYALKIGAHRQTVVRTTVRLRVATVSTVLTTMADDYDTHIAHLVASACGIHLRFGNRRHAKGPRHSRGSMS